MRTLLELREEIDQLDNLIVSALVRRLHVADEVAEAKRGRMAVRDEKREKELKKRIGILSGADAPYVLEVFDRIIEVSCARQSNDLRRGANR